MCPVEAAYVLWANARKLGLAPTDPLCTLMDKGKLMPLRETQIATLLKVAAISLGKDPNHFGTHSLRSGGATAMFKGSISKTAIKLFGRWTSDAFERYIQIADCDVEDMASRWVGKWFRDPSSCGQPPTQPGGLVFNETNSPHSHV